MSVLESLAKEVKLLMRRVERLEVLEMPRFVPLTTYLTSTSWDGDSHSTTAKTLIDLSAVFGVPANIKAVLVNVAIQDSDALNTDSYILLSPNATASQGSWLSCLPANDRYNRAMLVVPCDANGDVYIQIAASGVGTMDVWLQIWAYWL